MATFEDAIGYVLVNEGSRLLDRRKTTGEYSRYGITLATATAAGVCQPADTAYIDALNVVSATAFYQAHVWPHLFDGIRAQDVATKLFDMVVNMGAVQAVKLAQRACNALGATLNPDGQLGYQTLSAINGRDGRQLVLELCALCVAFYEALVTQNPAKYEVDWESWKARGEKRP